VNCPRIDLVLSKNSTSKFTGLEQEVYVPKLALGVEPCQVFGSEVNQKYTDRALNILCKLESKTICGSREVLIYDHHLVAS
jgi:hypothetical protein